MSAFGGKADMLQCPLFHRKRTLNARRINETASCGHSRIRRNTQNLTQQLRTFEKPIGVGTTVIRMKDCRIRIELYGTMVDPLNQLPKPKDENGSDGSAMPNGTLDGFNHVLDFDEGLTHVFRVSTIVFLRQSFGDVASVRNLSISCRDQLLNILVILSHSGGLLLINLFAWQPWQLGDIGRDPLLFKYSRHVRRRTPQFLKRGKRMPSICNSSHLCTNWSS